MKEYFKEQLNNHPKITEKVFDLIEFKVLWSGERIKIGDIVVYAMVFDVSDDKLKLVSFVDRELESLTNIFDFIGYTNDVIPVLKFKTDTKNRII